MNIIQLPNRLDKGLRHTKNKESLFLSPAAAKHGLTKRTYPVHRLAFASETEKETLPLNGNVSLFTLKKNCLVFSRFSVFAEAIRALTPLDNA